MKIALLNTTILTNNGVFELKDISLEEAKSMVKNSDEVVSAIGHQSTAEVLSSLLEYPVQVNRINFIQYRDTACICFKLRGRPQEGVILSLEEIEDIGYDFKLLTMV